ncbi:isochorismate synthase [Oculatella sp. FACHB-28]|uniref:isochorismate synthase n=1 Tax=Oculatella sp. FACHB-28 TaxID=2692845 RepID=UPI001686042C|nr:isochorismate synthase [Oculatella sp. FACHB-28]MBD1870688.1 isochorismate synthase [Cyanobacteria bacterium FACHB-471]MBD2058430.1 isochorismate synthase [Oculatella sp. FACHB-28]
MPVIPHSVNLFQDCKQFFQFLSICQQKSIEQNETQIASISLKVDRVDPLAVLHEIATPDQLHFYIENPAEDEAIAAIGAVSSLKTSGKTRFFQAQNFTESCFNHLVSATSSNYLLPRCFCSFSFFDQGATSEATFSEATIFLPKWQVSSKADQSTVILNLAIHANSNLELLIEQVCREFQNICLAKYGIFNLSSNIQYKLNHWNVNDTNNFKVAVASALKSIQIHHLNKLVLAHAVDIVSKFPFQWIDSLHHLRKIYPDCYTFSTGNGKGQNFIGASPECLIRICDRQLNTEALAGSAPRGKTVTADADLANRLLNSSKERHEHQVVVDFIAQQLSRFGLNPQIPAVPKLRQLTNIQHLHTPIQATLPKYLHPLKILAQLHPTPAVAGMPRDFACEEIRRYEKFERSLYAAPLGWIDAQGNAEFIVGIRSALIDGHHARLYAGAGIVAGSNPNRELAEVKLKLQTLLQALV